MRPGEAFLLFAVAVVALAPFASAQDDPTVNESDFDTSTPQGDEAYLDESENETANATGADGSTPTSDDANATGEDASDPTLAEGDFDMSVPTDDEAYLDEAEAEATGPTANAPAPGGASTPGAGALLVAVAGGAAAIALRRR